MGANDNCYNCEQPLDFFYYYVLTLTRMNGPEKVHEEAIRFCRNCVTFRSEESMMAFTQ